MRVIIKTGSWLRRLDWSWTCGNLLSCVTCILWVQSVLYRVDVTRDLEPVFETFRESERKKTDGRTHTQASHLWLGFRIVLSPKNMFSWCEAGDHIENVARGTLFSFFGFGDGSTSLWNLLSSSCDKNQPWNWSFTLGGWRIKQSGLAVTMLRYWVKTHSALAAGENALNSAR